MASLKQFTKIVGQCVLYVCTEGSIRKITIIITLSNKRLESHWVLTSANSPLAAEELHGVKTCFLGTIPLGPDNLLHMCYTVIFSNNNKHVNESKVFFFQRQIRNLFSNVFQESYCWNLQSFYSIKYRDNSFFFFPSLGTKCSKE